MITILWTRSTTFNLVCENYFYIYICTGLSAYEDDQMEYHAYILEINELSRISSW